MYKAEIENQSWVRPLHGLVYIYTILRRAQSYEAQVILYPANLSLYEYTAAALNLGWAAVTVIAF